jgi:hypothetical protein
VKFSHFRDADGLTTAQVSRTRAVSLGLALSEAQRNSLVKRSKSLTPANHAGSSRDWSEFEPIVEIEESPALNEVSTRGAGKYTVIQYREWSDEYRVRTRVETSKANPPINEGARYSDLLSSRGARNITNSCYFMAAKHGGFKTFVTGTFDADTRATIAAGKTTIQKEVSRTMNSMHQMHKRGWQTETGEKIGGSESPLAYCWVVEIPKNEQGEENPHVHMMINWQVGFKYFDQWSKRIEGIWGNGFFHLEKIKDPLCAGAYMAKAAGYMTKGKQVDQGIVKGNRYGISKNARAPDWYTVQEAELGVMGRLIAELHESCLEKYGSLRIERNDLTRLRDATPKANKATRQKIGAKLAAVREKIEAVPIVTSKYQVILKGSAAFTKFIIWAKRAGWEHSQKPTSLWLSLFNGALARRKQARLIRLQRWDKKEFEQALNDYEGYQFFEEADSNYDDFENYSIEGMVCN